MVVSDSGLIRRWSPILFFSGACPTLDASALDTLSGQAPGVFVYLSVTKHLIYRTVNLSVNTSDWSQFQQSSKGNRFLYAQLGIDFSGCDNKELPLIQIGGIKCWFVLVRKQTKNIHIRTTGWLSIPLARHRIEQSGWRYPKRNG